MTARELGELDDDALRDHIATARRDVFGLRMQHATGELAFGGPEARGVLQLARSLTVATQRGVDPNVRA